MAVAALFAVLTLVMTFPLSITANRTLPSDDPDGHLFMWTLAWDAHAFVHQPLAIFDANIFYPMRNTLALSENLLGSAVIAAPVLWITGNPVLAVNVVSLLSCALCGLGAYVLSRRLGLTVAASLLAGLIFEFAPPRFFRFSQLHLTAVQWIPFMLASLHGYLDEGRRRDLLWAIGFFTLEALTSGHGAVFATVAILALGAYRIALGEPVRLAQRGRDLGVMGSLLLAPSVLILIPYRMNQVDVGLRRVLDSAGTPLESFIASPTPVHVFLQSLLLGRVVNADATAWLFPGVIPLVLTFVAAISGGVVLIRQRTPIRWRTSEPLKTSPAGRLSLLALSSALLVWVATSAAPSLLRTGDGLTARDDGSGRTVWTGYLQVEQDGRYNFGTTADAASRLTIDDTVVIDRPADRPESPKTGGLRLDRGAHRLLMEPSQANQSLMPELLWEREGVEATYRPVPSWALSRRLTTPSVTRVVRLLDMVRVGASLAAGLAFIWWTCQSLVRRRTAWTEWGAPFRRSPTAFYLLLMVVCVSLALGASGPWRFVYWLPGLNFVRGPSRFMTLGVLAIAVLAGIGFDRLCALLAPVRRPLAAVVVGLLLLAECAAVPFRGVPYRVDTPAADLWVARQPRPFSIAEVPAPGSERYNSNYMLHSMVHWQKTVHGFSGIVPPLHEELYRLLRRFPSDESLRRLAEIDVRYVIVHSSWYPPEERTAVERSLSDFDRWLKLEYQDSDSRVYSIRPDRR